MKNAVDIIVCEDIRVEEGGRRSYMGVFGEVMILDTLPVTMRLSFVIRFRSIDTKIKNIHIRGKLNELVFLNHTFKFSKPVIPKRHTSTDRYLFEIRGFNLPITEVGILSIGTSTDNKTFVEDEIAIVHSGK